MAALQLLFAHSFVIALEIVPSASAAGGVDLAFEAISEGSLRRRISILALGSIGGILLFRSRTRTIKLTPFAGGAAALFVLWSSLSLVWAVEPLFVARRLVSFWLLLLAAVGVVRWAPPRSIPWFLGLSSVFYVVLGVVTELALGAFAPFAPGYRFSGTLHPNAQGINCALLVLSGIWISIAGGRRNRVLGIALGICGLTFLILTRSRTSFAAALGASLVLLVLCHRSKGRWIGVAVLANVAILLAMSFVNGLLDQPLKLLLLGREIGDVATLNSRIPLWEVLASYLAERPIAGYGFSGFMTPRHAAEVAVMYEFGIAGAHSVYLEILLGVGVVGLALFLLTLISAFVHGAFESCNQRLRGGVSLFAAIVAFELLNGVLDSTLVFPTWRFPSLLAIAVLCLKPALAEGSEAAPRRPDARSGSPW